MYDRISPFFIDISTVFAHFEKEEHSTSALCDSLLHGLRLYWLTYILYPKNLTHRKQELTYITVQIMD